MLPGLITRKMRPTQKHQPVIWECMLGTVYARDAAGNVKYFDYDYEAAIAWAGITPDTKDIRVARYSSTWSSPDFPKNGQWAIYILRST